MTPKFRVWDKIQDKMFDVEEIKFIYDELVEDTDAVFYYDNKECSRSFLFHDCVTDFMQSTGMFDKNGKEIFEGDVVEIRKYDGLYDALMSLPFKYKGVVDFNKGKWEIIIEKDRLPLFSEYKGIEVVGNKYMGEYKEFLNERL